MARITPCRDRITERFPLLSFVVEVAPDRPFEIVCTTEARLLEGENGHLRTPENFFTTAEGGLLRAPAGQATYMLPPDVLCGFAGASRLHYALATHGGVSGSDLAFSVHPSRFAEAPSVQIARDFTGRSLGGRLGKRTAARPSQRYGAAQKRLGWGGDRVGARAVTPAATQGAYRDGYDDGLWQRMPRGVGAAVGRAQSTPSLEPEPPGYGDGAELHAASVTAPRLDPIRPPSEQPIPLTPAVGATYGLGERYGRRARYGGAAAVDVAEPPGYEDAPALAQAGVAARPVSPRAPVSEPRPATRPAATQSAAMLGARYRGEGGYEDAPDRARRLGGPFTTTEGRDALYASDDGGELPLALARGARSLEQTMELSIPEKFRIVRVVAQAESGSDGYAAINADTEFRDPSNKAHYQTKHVGLSWGLVQFTQRHGALGRVLAACARRDGARFAAVFGPSADALLAVVTAPDEESRLQPVDGASLWEEPWLARFRAAGAETAFQAAQNEIAITDYLDPQLPFCRALGLDTDRAIAMVYDRSVHRGVGGARRFIAEALIPIHTVAERETALRALRLDVRGVQERCGLPIDGVWGPRTAAATLELLRALPEPPIAIPSRQSMIRSMVVAAAGTRAEARLARLESTSELSDVVYRIP